MRLYELARDLGKKSDELVTLAKNLGLNVANRLSGVSEADVAALRKAIGAPSSATPPAAKPSRPPLAQKPPATAPHARPSTPAPQARPSTPAPPQARPSTPAPQARPSTPAPHARPSTPAPQGRPSAPAHHARPSGHGGAPASRPGPSDRSSSRPPEAPRGKVVPPESEAAAAHRRRRKGGRHQTAEEEAAAAINPVLGRYVPPSTIPRYPKHGMRRGRPRGGRGFVPASTTPRVTRFEIQTPISLKELSALTGVKANLLILKIMQAGGMVTINAMLNAAQVEQLGKEVGLEFVATAAETAESTVEHIEAQETRAEDLRPRPPVVTFLGHVDHGKTSLLDCILKTDVAAHEHGGITQHIAAHRVTLNGKTVTFLDTPGHEAFTSMRARGANVTDIATLVVAADDGVMPQTEEAIDHARAAGTTIVVAVNKCDKPEANPQRVRQELSNLGLQPEEWGGETVFVDVSAITGQGVDDLIEMLALVAELKELKANPTSPARGTVLEAQMSETRGPVATVLVQDGRLCVGDIIVCGSTFGRVKAMYDDHDKLVREVGPSSPVAVVGLGTLPEAGDRLVVIEDIQKARAIAEERQNKAREAAMSRREHVSLETLFTSIEKGRTRELLLILKGDVRGTLEALHKILSEIKSEEVKLSVLRASVGGISTSDVLLADASDAIIVGMNVVPDTAARALAEQKGVAIHTYNVIYRVKEEIEKALSGMLAPEEREVVTGHAEIRQLFRISRVGNIAGCFVRDGVISRNNRVRLVRDGIVVHDGRLASLKRNKDDMREVREGFECGMHLESYDDLKIGDIIESYTVEKVARTLGSTTSA